MPALCNNSQPHPAVSYFVAVQIPLSPSIHRTTETIALKPDELGRSFSFKLQKMLVKLDLILAIACHAIAGVTSPPLEKRIVLIEFPAWLL